MARRLEIVVPNDQLTKTRGIIEDYDKLNLGRSDSPINAHINYYNGSGSTMIHITVSARNVGELLSKLDKYDIGKNIGTIGLTSFEFMKPQFKRYRVVETKSKYRISNIFHRSTIKGRITSDSERDMDEKLAEITEDDNFRSYRKAPLTINEVYGQIVHSAQMTSSSWINLIGASLIAAGGAATNNVPYIIAGILVSPLTGPIIAGTFAYHVADWKLFLHAIKTVVMMSATAFMVAFCFIFPFEIYNSNARGSAEWTPNRDAIYQFGYFTDMLFTGVIAISTGVVLGNAILRQRAGDPKSLIACSISAGLLVPIINAGILLALSILDTSTTQDDVTKQELIDKSRNSFISFLIHGFGIFLGGNIYFTCQSLYKTFHPADESINTQNTKTLLTYCEQLKQMGLMDESDGQKPPLWTRFVPLIILKSIFKANNIHSDSNGSVSISNPINNPNPISKSNHYHNGEHVHNDIRINSTNTNDSDDDRNTSSSKSSTRSIRFADSATTTGLEMRESNVSRSSSSSKK